MGTRKRNVKLQILDHLKSQRELGDPECDADSITHDLKIARSTINRHLAHMTADKVIVRLHSGPATRYVLPDPNAPVTQIDNSTNTSSGSSFQFSSNIRAAVESVMAPVANRKSVGYKHSFVASYIPNFSSLLLADLSQDLFKKSKARGNQPTGAYARAVRDEFVVDLAWNSSRLEGNNKTLLETKTLFSTTQSAVNEVDVVMLLNHKDAIEFIVDEGPESGIKDIIVRNIHSMLLQGLLKNTDALGTIRNSVVTGTEAVYAPLQVASLLNEHLISIVTKANQINNPVEAAFFLWVNIAYLQPFEDGNHPTSRLMANFPLLLQNCAPIAFEEVDPADYELALLAIYKQRNVWLASELFEWTYQKSIQKYSNLMASTSAPDPVRLKYREALAECIRRVVSRTARVSGIVSTQVIEPADREEFFQLLVTELKQLETYNCARYKLGLSTTDEWIKAGRPGISLAS